jgi:ATP-dependent DNA helicase RecG
MIGGTLFDQVEGAMLYFREHLETRYEFRGEAAREVIWEYPLEALREAATNAVCHRDYLEFAHTQVRWFDDRLVFLNPGELPPSIRLDQLKEPHASWPRNRKIAEIFFYAGLIEQWGSGIEKMLRECAAAGLPEPDFEERAGCLWVTFRKDPFTPDRLRALGLNDRQIRAVRWAQEHGAVSNREYRQLTGLSDEGARHDLQDLVQKGILRSEGQGRSARYVLQLGD